MENIFSVLGEKAWSLVPSQSVLSGLALAAVSGAALFAIGQRILVNLRTKRIVQTDAEPTHPFLQPAAAAVDANPLPAFVQLLVSEAIPAADDTTSFLESLAERLEAVEAAHARPADPALRCRPDDIIQSCMRGDVAVLLRSSWFELDSKQRVIRVFLSSTFTDTVHERAVLLRCVHPVVQCYARKLNFEVVLSEMRFGIRKSLSDDNKTSEVCMTELERCAEESASMSYMLFVRNKYGFRPPPRRVPRVDMEAMLALLPPGDQHFILECYELDENEVVTPQACYRISVNMHGDANVAAATYVLRNTSLIPNYWCDKLTKKGLFS